jgi:hypothetical protein
VFRTALQILGNRALGQPCPDGNSNYHPLSAVNRNGIARCMKVRRSPLAWNVAVLKPRCYRAS